MDTQRLEREKSITNFIFSIVYSVVVHGMPRPISHLLVPLILFPVIYTLIVASEVHVDVSEIILLFFMLYMLVGLPILMAGIKIIPENQVAVVFRGDLLLGVFGPGVILIDAVFDKLVRVELVPNELRLIVRGFSRIPISRNGLIISIIYRGDYSTISAHLKEIILRCVISTLDGLWGVKTRDLILGEETIRRDLMVRINSSLRDIGVEVEDVIIVKSS